MYLFLFHLSISLSLIPAKIQDNKGDKNPFFIIGYYAGPHEKVDSFEIKKLTHIIFSFGHLKNNELHIGSAADSLTIRRMVEWKKKHPKLKVMLSLGGWGGCETCSDVFSTPEGRNEFAQSVKRLTDYFHTDGLDLDWEYPAIEGYPGHSYSAQDKVNFTSLCRTIREVNGSDFILSFAAGGFDYFIDNSIDWKGVEPYVDFVNIMSYDLVHGASDTSGHHTPLYSTLKQKQSTDNAVRRLVESGMPSHKLVIGAAFYGRFFKIKEGFEVGLYQPCQFENAFSYHNREEALKQFEIMWDETAQAPYGVQLFHRLLATYDDERSIALKTKYALDNRLGGIMFWQMMDDEYEDGLLDVMWRTKRKYKRK